VVASTREHQAKDTEAHKRQMTSTSIKSGDSKIKDRCLNTIIIKQDQQEAIRQLLVAQKPQHSNLRSKPSKETPLSPYTKLGQARTPS